MVSRQFSHLKQDKNINMEKETLKISSLSQGDNKPLYSSLLAYNLPILIEKMMLSPAWLKRELNSMILLESPGKQILLTTLHEGTEINFPQSNDSATFQVVEGKMEFHTRKESVNLNKGQSLTLHEKIKYSLTSMEDTVFLLTISNGILQPAEN
jgi:quercetin dioxygenase-like cupin family protein